MSDDEIAAMRRRLDAHVATIVVEPHVIDIERGVWCDHCLLPSAATGTVLLCSPATLDVLRRWRQGQCQDCGHVWTVAAA